MEKLRALKKAIFEKATSSDSLTALVDSRVYDTTAPEGAAAPWIRYSITASADENVFVESSPIITRGVVTFDVLSIGSVATEAENVLEALEATFDGASLTGDGWDFDLKRIAERKVWDSASGAWILSADYRVLASCS
ncbi:MAG: DUF3168 domain-containing protein [Candidatus Methanosuratincola petrocarbonis]